jgi:hypothetical protein
MDIGKERPHRKANVLFLRLQMSHEPGMRRFLDWERLPPADVPPGASDMVIFSDLSRKYDSDYDGSM